MKDIKKEVFNGNYLIPVSIQGTEQILFQIKNCISKFMLMVTQEMVFSVKFLTKMFTYSNNK